ncbi:MAG: type II toxin-antitoxin system VapC family toxin [Candidatus Poribacteria bacterium]
MKLFVYDANAVARIYFPDIGTDNLKQIASLPDKAILIPRLAQIESCSAFLEAVDQGHITQREYNFVKRRLNSDIARDVLQVVELDNKQALKAQELLERHRPIPGVRRKLKGADSVYLATAVLLADSMKPVDVRVILVTSDMALYQSALSEPNVEAFHFWTCQCPKCGQIDIPTKMKEHQCPNPKCTFACISCCLANCKSAYVVGF